MGATFRGFDVTEQFHGGSVHFAFPVNDNNPNPFQHLRRPHHQTRRCPANYINWIDRYEG
jgi:hypothetical protein